MSTRRTVVISKSSGKDDEAYCNWFVCPNPRCPGQGRLEFGFVVAPGNIAEGSRYCPDCGRKIEWVDRTAAPATE